jgi:hypothetical protein
MAGNSQNGAIPRPLVSQTEFGWLNLSILISDPLNGQYKHADVKYIKLLMMGCKWYIKTNNWSYCPIKQDYNYVHQLQRGNMFKLLHKILDKRQNFFVMIRLYIMLINIPEHEKPITWREMKAIPKQ